jgi:hypothetical protein
LINYTSYVQQIGNLLTYTTTEVLFQTMLPGMIDYAEQRLYRELDLLATRTSDSTNCVPGQRGLTLPTNFGSFLVVEEVLLVTSSNNVLPLVNTAIDFIYLTGGTVSAQPEFWATFNNTTLSLSPIPNSSYTIVVYGTQRPTPLSSGNSSTILTQMLPDVFVCASMIFGTGFQRDFGAQSDNPQATQSWEQQYQKLIQSANTEELRKKYQSQAWSNQIPNPIATPPRV